MAQRKTPRFNKPLHEPERPEIVKPEPPANFDLLSDFEKDEIRRQAEAKVIAREKARAEDAFLAAEMKRIERERNPKIAEEERTITIDVALYADKIVLDGTPYEYGRTYVVSKPVFETLVDIQARTYRHENELQSGNAYNSFYTRQRYKNIPGANVPPYATISGETGSATLYNGAPVRF